MENRRDFIKKVSVGVAAVAVGSRHLNLSARSYTHIPRANDTIRVGVVGFSDRFRSSLLPSFMNHAQDLNFEIVALSDIWNRRREEGKAYIKEKTGWDVTLCRNNDELYDQNDIDAVSTSTADFQHALHLVEAAKA